MLQFLQLPATSAVIQVATLEGKPKEEIEAQDKVATPAPKRIPNQRERKGNYRWSLQFSSLYTRDRRLTTLTPI